MIPKTVSGAAILWMWIVAVAIFLVALGAQVEQWDLRGVAGGLVLLGLLLAAGAGLLWRYASCFGPVKVSLFVPVVVITALIFTVLLAVLAQVPWGRAVLLSLLWAWPFGAFGGARQRPTGPAPSGHAA